MKAPIKKMTRKEAKASKELLPRTRQEAIDTNHTFYFTGNECKRKHLSPRQVADYRCIECIAARQEAIKTLPCHLRDRAKKTEINVRCRVRKLGLLPKDYDSEECLKFYIDSASLTKIYGVPFQVDHQTPLSKGGLHHQDNLQVMPASMNRRKGSMNMIELTQHDLCKQLLTVFAYGKAQGEFIGQDIEDEDGDQQADL
jgi:hypothetical protein